MSGGEGSTSKVGAGLMRTLANETQRCRPTNFPRSSKNVLSNHSRSGCRQWKIQAQQKCKYIAIAHIRQHDTDLDIWFMDTIESPMVAENKIVFSDRNLMMVVGAKYKMTRKAYERRIQCQRFSWTWRGFWLRKWKSKSVGRHQMLELAETPASAKEAMAQPMGSKRWFRVLKGSECMSQLSPY